MAADEATGKLVVLTRAALPEQPQTSSASCSAMKVLNGWSG